MARQGLWRWRWRRWWYQSAPIFVPYSTTVIFFLQLTKKMCSLATMVIFLQITTEMWSFFFHHGDFCTNHQRNAFPFHFDDFFLLIANVMVSFLTRVVFLPTTEILSFFTTVVSVLISIEMQSHFIMIGCWRWWFFYQSPPNRSLFSPQWFQNEFPFYSIYFSSTHYPNDFPFHHDILCIKMRSLSNQMNTK